MKIWIALFRGINVGGNNLLPMAKLKVDLETIGLSNIRTYIQSGNVVFDASIEADASLCEKITELVKKKYGFSPQVLILSGKQLLTAIESNPFPKAVTDPSKLHFSFLAEAPTKPDLTALEIKKTATEKYKLIDQVFYLHAPDGIGRSKLAANVEKHLGVVATARNYRTVEKLLAMVTT